MVRGLIFDLDDTLYPRERYVHGGLAAVARHVAELRGLACDDLFAMLCRAHERAPGRELQALCLRYGLHARVVPQLLAVFREHRPALWLAHAAEATLVQLRREGWRLAVLTNGYPPVQKRKVEALRLDRLVDHVVYADEHAQGGKPHRTPFTIALARLGVTAAQCVMVGDDLACDVEGARGAGLRAIWLERGRRRGGSVTAADACIRALDEVPGVADALVREEAMHAA